MNQQEEYLGSLSQRLEAGSWQVYQLKSLEYLEENLSQVNGKCAPLMEQLLPTSPEHCSLHSNAPNVSLCIWMKVNSVAKNVHAYSLNLR